MMGSSKFVKRCDIKKAMLLVVRASLGICGVICVYKFNV